MSSLQSSIDQMNQLLNELIWVSTQLRAISFQVLSQEDLVTLQKKQEDILKQIESQEQLLQTNYRNQIDSKTWDHFHKKLQEFQELNHEFIQNVNTNLGLIQFELKKFEDEQENDYSDLSLKKSRPSPNSSKTVKPKKNK